MVGSRETGNETYVRGLISGFSQLDSEFRLYAYHLGRAWAEDDSRVQFRPIADASPWVRLTLGLATRAIRDSLDVLHVTYTVPLWALCPIVVTVHDISYATHPEWFSKRDLRVLSATVPLSIRRARQVITVSDVCRNQIIEHYHVPPEKVAAIPNAAGPAGNRLRDETAHEELAALGLDPRRPYVLAVGNLQPRKNLVRLIGAMSKIVAAGLDVDLLIAGPEHYRAEEVLSAGRDAARRIRFTGYITDRQLAACYSRATVFAFPSLFEGFGIPALEAMAHGVPVVCSNAGALPEVCGEAALYFDPLDVDSMADALMRVITDSALRTELSRLGRAREQQFTWLGSAQRTLRVYEKAAQRTTMRETTGH
jgi:glycosyltransferase involved in cell wall biosynthesis